jgi:hypothetical protein
MSGFRGGPQNTARARKEALEEAEALLVRPGPTDATELRIEPRRIRTRPVLFQPREFSYGGHNVDPEHVKKLKRAAEIAEGDLDAMLVIKLGPDWVCVDGHHRLAAYGNGHGAVPCEWFPGTVGEAVDQSMALNKKDKLAVPQKDRLEEAWKRTLLGHGSKREVRLLCGVSEGVVAHMRRVRETAQAQDAGGNLFRERLGASSPRQGLQKLMDTSWSMAKLQFLGVDQKEITDETLAARLASAIHGRLTNRLSRDPAITARALRLYDPELPEKLMEAWGRPRNPYEAAKDDDDVLAEDL